MKITRRGISRKAIGSHTKFRERYFKTDSILLLVILSVDVVLNGEEKQEYKPG